MKKELENLKKEYVELREKEVEIEFFVGNFYVKLRKCKFEFEVFFVEEVKVRGVLDEMIVILN